MSRPRSVPPTPRSPGKTLAGFATSSSIAIDVSNWRSLGDRDRRRRRAEAPTGAPRTATGVAGSPGRCARRFLRGPQHGRADPSPCPWPASRHFARRPALRPMVGSDAVWTMGRRGSHRERVSPAGFTLPCTPEEDFTLTQKKRPVSLV